MDTFNNQKDLPGLQRNVSTKRLQYVQTSWLMVGQIRKKIQSKKILGG